MKKTKLFLMFLMGKIRRLFFMQLPENERDYKVAKILFMVDAALSGVITPLVGGTVIATVLSEMNVNDGFIGIISSWAIMFGIAQIIAIPFTNKLKKRKLFVCVLASVSRMLQGFLLLVPFMDFLNGTGQIAVFIILYSVAYILAYVFNPPYMEWVNSMVPGSERGRFFGKRNAYTIFASSAATFVSGVIMDKYVPDDRLRDACLLLAGIIIACSVLIFIALAAIKEPHSGYTDEKGREAHGSAVKRIQNTRSLTENVSLIKSCKMVLADKHFRPALVIGSLWNIVYYLTFSFMTTYCLSELQLGYVFISTITVVNCGVQTAFSGLMGKIGDKIGFEKLFVYVFAGVGGVFILNFFTSPENGAVMYALVQILIAVCTAAMTPCISALCMNRAKQGEEGAYVAVDGTIIGFLVALTSLVGGAAVTFFQKNEVVFIGKHLYGQQVLSLCSAALAFYAMFYLKQLSNKEKINK